MADATYSIRYTDSDGDPQTIKGVKDVKAMEKHIKSQGGSDIIVVKGSDGAKDPDPSTPDDSTTPVEKEGAAEPGDSPAEDAAEPKKKGSVPAGLAKYLAKKKS